MQTSLTIRLFFKKISPPIVVATLEVIGVKCVETLPQSIIGHSKKIQPIPNATKKNPSLPIFRVSTPKSSIIKLLKVCAIHVKSECTLQETMFTRVNALLKKYLSSLEDNRGREKQGKKKDISIVAPII